MEVFSTDLLYRPEDPRLGYLPEGPYPLGNDRLSWVSIQHDATSEQGSLNLLNLATGENESFELPGQPGFAFPTSDPQKFLVGLERQIVIFDTANGIDKVLASDIDAYTQGTIINDGALCQSGLIFGCKDLSFSEQKAGLYFLRREDLKLFELRRDQICSNGKVILKQDATTITFLDIDTPTQLVVRYELNVETGRLSPPQIVLDLSDEPGFPDGMIGLPDKPSVIIALFNPEAAPHGEARQYDVASGNVESIWQVEASPQVTCPQLVDTPEGPRLVLTTATEDMSAEMRAQHPNAGCLFSGPISVSRLESYLVWALD